MGPHDGDERKIGRRRAEERALQEEAAKAAVDSTEDGDTEVNNGTEEKEDPQMQDPSSVRGWMAPDTGVGLLASQEVESEERKHITKVMLDNALRADSSEEVMTETTPALPTCPAHLAEPEPRSYGEACESKFADVWKAAMASEFMACWMPALSRLKMR